MQPTPDRYTVVGVFADEASARTAVAALRQGLFAADEVSVEGGDQVSSGLVGALAGMGVPDDQARMYDQARLAGRTLVIVSAEGRQVQARKILRELHALVVDELAPEAVTTRRTPPSAGENSEADAPAQARALALTAEEVVALHRMVDDGDVLFHKEVRVLTRTIEISYRREELVVERRSAEHASEQRGDEPTTGEPDGPLAAHVRQLQPGQVIRMTLLEEEPSVEMRPVVYEEVTLGKQLVTETRRVSTDVRREQLRIGQGDAGSVSGLPPTQ